MSEQGWLDGYAGQTTDELIALDDAYRTDSIVLAFEAAIRSKAARMGGPQHLTDAERVILAVEALEREVNSDGYDGLFRNASQQVPDVVSSLEVIGSDAVAALTRSAISVLKIEGPITAEAVESAMEEEDDERDDRLDDLDQAYQQTAGDLADPLLAFIKTHRDQITLARPTREGSLLDRASRSLRGLLERLR
jgi:Domain of unknown function (DUF4375)